MNVTVNPSVLEGNVVAPPSKSLMQRACIAAFLSDGESVIGNPCLSEDCLHMLDALEQLGAKIHSSEAGIHISRGTIGVSPEVNSGESGLGTRLLIPLLASFDKPIKLISEGSMKSRPLDSFLLELPKHGVELKTEVDGQLPWTITGPLQAGNFVLDGEISSQFLSGLLMILPTLDGDSTIEVKNLQSKPYIDLSIEVMEYFGISVLHQDYERFRIPGNQKYKSASIFIDGDWSSAATLFVAAAVASRDTVRIDEVGGDFTQADSVINGALLFAGCRIHREEHNYLVYPGKLRSFLFNANDCPDLFPVLAALAVFGKGPSRISGVSRLIHKESNRALAIQEEFAKAGIKVEIEGDEMIIHPGKVQAAKLSSHNDHRIVMAATILGLGGASIVIEGAEAVSKSYPNFFEDLSKLGASISKKK